MTLTSPTYRRVPIVHETLADLDTPLSVYLKLANGPYSYLLESAQNAGDDGGKWGRYSIIGLPARTIIRVRGSLIEVISDGEVTESVQTDDPLTFC
jgi:anthranilate synthase component 1